MSNVYEARVGIVTYEQMSGKVQLGSTRIRANWLLNHWREAEVFTIGRKYDVVIFQKAYWTEYAVTFPGIKILDLCDPDFLNWNSPCLVMANLCDAVVTSTQRLATIVGLYTPVKTAVIPDRIDFQTLPTHTSNRTYSTSAMTVAWFGYSENFPALDAAIEDLVAARVARLLVIASSLKPYQPPDRFVGAIRVINCEWDEELALSLLRSADILINYRPGVGRWVYKSDNKTAFAQALGIPVAHSKEQLTTLLDPSARQLEAERSLLKVRETHDVKLSVLAYRSLIEEITLCRLKNE